LWVEKNHENLFKDKEKRIYMDEEIKITREVDTDKVSQLIHVLGYNFGEVSKAILGH